MGVYVVALDVGTSSVRAILFDGLGRQVPGMEGRRPCALRTTPDGGADMDADELVERAAQAIDELLAKTAVKIDGVATCTFWHSLVGVDSGGRAVTPVYTWADTRADTAGELRRRLDEKAVHARTGCVFHSTYPSAKILWLKGRAERWMSIGEYLFLRLFGRTAASVSIAAGSGLFDVHLCAWDPEMLLAVSILEDQLSPIGDAPLAGLREPYASRWPALKEVPWALPVGDGAANSVGSGCASRDRIALMVGTSGAMRVVWRAEEVTIPWGLFCYRADRSRFVMGGALSTGGNLVEWARNTLRLDAFEDVIGAMEPDAHGLTFLPLLAGERSPGWADSARAAITGLTLSTRPVDILRAGLEAVALRFALLHEKLPPAREIVASGGALLNSPAWLQIMADALGRPVVASAETESSCRGAALLFLGLPDAPAALGRAYEPDGSRRPRYAAALERQRALYETLTSRTL